MERNNKKTYSRKPSGTPKVGNKPYKPSIIDGYMSFFTSLIRLPLSLMIQELDPEKIYKYLENTEVNRRPVTLRGIINAIFRPKTEDEVGFAFETLLEGMGKTQEKQTTAAQYAMKAFIKMNEYTKDPTYAAANEEFMEFVASNFGIDGTIGEK